ncbi:MAG: glucose 1-dehydrogenase [bacterium]|nr:glucose 1-dehydrogenase [bacterium]
MNISQKFDLTGKTAIVTGSSKGIGLAIAKAFAQQGAKVVISSRKQEAVDEVAKEFENEGQIVAAIACHMGDSNQIQNLVEETVKKFGGIDVVVNNAATNPIFGNIQDADGGAFDKIMGVNVKGPWELATLAYPHLKENGGSVINISSIEGITPGQGLGLYSVSKSALITLSKVLAREWGHEGIRANTICPGLIKTKFSEALTSNEHILKHVLAKQALPQVAEPIDIAGLALFLASDASSFCTGQEFTADGGYTI